MRYLLTNNLLLWLFLFLHSPFPVQDQEPAFVRVNGEMEFQVTPGEETHLKLFFRIRENFHIQANRVNNENLIPSVLSVDGAGEMAIGEPVFPKGHEFRMDGVEEPLYVYSELLEVVVPIKTEKHHKGEFPLKGKLHYQPCDATKCYFPRDLDFVIRVHVQ
ncbi:protein-disulfide reductase DsbD domain-containing protein [Negadavirga shengliensis]|uniref:Protein-disulfide reductase DsbD domain-containing protein n=1 Tax=Negadavirga shengliensis TaxID=1389218 RepID=A0ABV9T180_9BACT